ncbi:NmrA domain-containing protein [Mycena chlorophos]|uniref:NmrA domain-containing protein n=1 Tax=Mycena chlorophos TaxID=658473 RepID=A0A8H6SMV1_MYCCL|nr:NmrA domain-containing protein [Mycena chlorophos]
MSQNIQYTNVIVFGPAGDVGGLVALEAHKHGAQVWLAMRDTTKSIPADVEKSGNFARVQADLVDPPSVTKALAESGAKAAFLYVSRAALQALHDSGVENIVLLSGAVVKGEGAALREIPSTAGNAFKHAQCEIAVEDLGFPYFTALRPSWFASNYLKFALNRWSKPMKAQIPVEDAYFDNVAPEDIGAVGGTALVGLPQAGLLSKGKTTLYLYGREWRTVKENWELIKKVTGRDDIDTTPMAPETFVQTLTTYGLPEAEARFLVAAQERARTRIPQAEHDVGIANVRKYLGREPMSFVEYLEAHKAEWKSL